MNMPFPSGFHSLSPISSWPDHREWAQISEVIISSSLPMEEVYDLFPFFTYEWNVWSIHSDALRPHCPLSCFRSSIRSLYKLMVANTALLSRLFLLLQPLFHAFFSILPSVSALLLTSPANESLLFWQFYFYRNILQLKCSIFLHHCPSSVLDLLVFL